MAEVTVKELYNAGAHFGHHSRFWNPKLAPYIYCKYQSIHIIDLDKTLPLLKEALSFIHDLTVGGGTLLMVGTKRAASDIIKEQAQRCNMPFVNHRWLGGTLTNYRTIRSSINQYKDMKELIEKNHLKTLNKKNAQKYRRKYLKLKRSCEGLSILERTPSAMFVIDVGFENIAVKEAKKLGIPVVALVDTNCAIEGVDYIIPANDDGIETIRLCTTLVADTVNEAVVARAERELVPIAKEVSNKPDTELVADQEAPEAQAQNQEEVAEADTPNGADTETPEVVEKAVSEQPELSTVAKEIPDSESQNS